MANARETPLIGISAFGRVVGGTKIPFGHTEEDGFEIAADVTKHDIRSGQSVAKRRSVPVSVDATFTVRLQDVDLANVRDLSGLPAGALTGDLNGSTPSAEVLKVFAHELATMEGEWYVEGPGPNGPREVRIHRAAVRTTPRLAFSSRAHQVLEATFDIFEADDVTPLYTITDNL